MAKRKPYRSALASPAKGVTLTKTSVYDDRFSISSYTLNNVDGFDFPGNITPEGYFYSPFYEVTLKELDDELQSVGTRRINFVPSGATTNVTSAITTFYRPTMGIFEDKPMWKITIFSPVTYDFIAGRPFAIYDILEETTFRGSLSAFTLSDNGGCVLEIASEYPIDPSGLRGQETSGKSRYIITMLDNNAPVYAEYIPSTGKLVWRGPKKMSDLTSDSPIYNMPFANGRHYIHRNLNVFVRRQDPHGEYKLYKPSLENPLRKFQVDGDAKLDFDYMQTIIDSMVDAC